MTIFGQKTTKYFAMVDTRGVGRVRCVRHNIRFTFAGPHVRQAQVADAA